MKLSQVLWEVCIVWTPPCDRWGKNLIDLEKSVYLAFNKRTIEIWYVDFNFSTSSHMSELSYALIISVPPLLSCPALLTFHSYHYYGNNCFRACCASSSLLNSFMYNLMCFFKQPHPAPGSSGIAMPRLRVEVVGNIVWQLLGWLCVMVNVLSQGWQTPVQQGSRM